MADTAKPAAAAKPAADEGTPAADVTPAAADDVKARMRAALERKTGAQHANATGPDGDSKVHEAHGPASHKRTFRRKSG